MITDGVIHIVSIYNNFVIAIDYFKGIQYNLFKNNLKYLECDSLALHEVLSALADETRRKILLKLREGRISSGDLAQALNMTPQALSYHLSKLKKADLIYETRYKNFIYYELNLSVLDEAILWMSDLKGGQP